MPQPVTQNPYVGVGALITPGLTSIIGALPGSPTIAQLVSAVVGYIQPTFYAGASQQVIIELNSVVYNVINSYRSNLVLSGKEWYNGNQVPFIEMLIGSSMLTLIQPNCLADRIADIEDNVGDSELTIDEQPPLFLATTCGTNALAYWNNQLSLGGASPWINYFTTNPGENYINTLQWNVAAMNGALAGYGATPNGLIDPTTNMIGNKIMGALAGALVATAGKLVFNWIPRITKPIPTPQSMSDFIQQFAFDQTGPNPINPGGLWKRRTTDEIGTVQRSAGCCDITVDGVQTWNSCM